MMACPVNGDRTDMTAGPVSCLLSVSFSIPPDRGDLETRVRQRLDDAFRDLLGFLGTHRVIRAIFSGIAKCGRNDRNGLMWIGQSALLGLHDQELVSRVENRTFGAEDIQTAQRKRAQTTARKELAASASRSPSPNTPNPAPTAVPVRTGSILP
jgi:hypothetical protein